jgi:dynein heavy chain
MCDDARGRFWKIACKIFHGGLQSVEAMTQRFYEEMDERHYYTTPSSYLELLKLYKIMLAIKKEQVHFKRDRISNGLHVSESNLMLI